MSDTRGYQTLFEWADAQNELSTRADQIFAAFVKFHKANPQVWVLFKKFTLEAVQRGRKNYSSKTIFERLRWHSEIETDGEEVKLNNNFTAYYARMFHAKFKDHDGFFRNRERTSAHQDPAAIDIQVFIRGEAKNEHDLLLELSDL